MFTKTSKRFLKIHKWNVLGCAMHETTKYIGYLFSIINLNTEYSDYLRCISLSHKLCLFIQFMVLLTLALASHGIAFGNEHYKTSGCFVLVNSLNFIFVSSMYSCGYVFFIVIDCWLFFPSQIINHCLVLKLINCTIEKCKCFEALKKETKSKLDVWKSRPEK